MTASVHIICGFTSRVCVTCHDGAADHHQEGEAEGEGNAAADGVSKQPDDAGSGKPHLCNRALGVSSAVWTTLERQQLSSA